MVKWLTVGGKGGWKAERMVRRQILKRCRWRIAGSRKVESGAQKYLGLWFKGLNISGIFRVIIENEKYNKRIGKHFWFWECEGDYLK